MLELTVPTPSPRVAESALRIFTVGLSHLVSRSSLLRDLFSSLAFPSSTVRIASGELQAFISAASGWAVRSLPVFFLYTSRAFSNICRKFGLDEEDAWRSDDIVLIARS